jgi:hypothetical protein
MNFKAWRNRALGEVRNQGLGGGAMSQWGGGGPFGPMKPPHDLSDGIGTFPRFAKLQTLSPLNIEREIVLGRPAILSQCQDGAVDAVGFRP